LDGVVLDEFADMKPEVWHEVVRPLKDWRKNPLHDWTSHAADALRTFACGYYESTAVSNPYRRPPLPRIGSHWSA
jgi:hypothetical protein